MFEDMVKSPAVWLSGKGEESAAVLSSRVRLARNIAGCKYPPSADSETGTRIVNYVDSTVSRSDLLGRGRYVRAGDISPLDRDFLVERHLISPAFLSGDLPKALYIGSQEQVSIMVNEEDHLRIQALASGLDPRGAYAAAKQYDQEIGRHLEYDYDPDFGFLTACPTNAGTGMRSSVLIHLPALVLPRVID
nr:ATP--guanido phosphotransferase [candidate division Zixibacteria bacterium]